MKNTFIHSKKLSLLILSLCLISSSNLSYLMATSASSPNPQSTSLDSKQSSKPSQIYSKEQRPFKRFTAAMEILEQKNIISKDDIKKIMKALMQLSIDTLMRTEDPDQAAADTLLRDKILTPEQHQKISELLKLSAAKSH